MICTSQFYALKNFRIKNGNFESYFKIILKNDIYLKMICASECTSELYVVYLVQLYLMI